MSECIGQAAPARPAWWRRFGRRNIAYIAFVVLLVPFGIALEASGPGGPDRGGGVAAVLMLGGIGTAMFFLANAILLIVALVKNRTATKPAIACALPIAIVLGMLLLEEIIIS
jgi:hypothetical protein